MSWNCQCRAVPHRQAAARRMRPTHLIPTRTLGRRCGRERVKDARLRAMMPHACSDMRAMVLPVHLLSARLCSLPAAT